MHEVGDARSLGFGKCEASFAKSVTRVSDGASGVVFAERLGAAFRFAAMVPCCGGVSFSPLLLCSVLSQHKETSQFLISGTGRWFRWFKCGLLPCSFGAHARGRYAL